MRAIVPIIFLTLAMAGVAAADGLPHVSEAMRRADFWIAQHPSPDNLVMTPEQITAFNAGLRAEGLTEDIAAMPPEISAEQLQMEAVKLFAEVERQKLFRPDGAMADASFYAGIRKNMALETLFGNIPLRYAMVTSFAHQRFIPTDEPLYTKPGNVHFDEVQNSGMDPGTPVVVLHQTLNGQWSLVKDGIAAGWVKRGTVAFTDEKTWHGAVDPESFVVVTSARTKVFLDEKMSSSAGEVRMGVRLPLQEMSGDSVAVTYPIRRDDGSLELVRGFVARGDVSAGYLPYNARTAITQAFKLLDAPYGWGDMEGKQDCSRFVNMVFATMGLHLPRNSSEQGRSGIALPSLAQATGGLTLLRLKGHIMLYLGMADGRPYAIHETWGYNEKTSGGEIFRPLGRVVVSDLSLGEGTAKGSLLERILAVRALRGRGFEGLNAERIERQRAD